jgi:hypothetical protein|tara:strand:+ start:676 stop:1335 length:660 start_codon:yes stop_codon:yes gene_type:complete
MTDKLIRVDYQMYRWGPLLIKTKIPDELRLKFLSEAKASNEDFETKLAGIVKKEVGFRNKDMFLPFFNKMFDMYADAQFKWSPEVGSKPEDFKEKYMLDSLWANFQGPGDFNPPHDHGGALSWVIYLTIPEALKEERAAYKGRSAGPGGITFIYGEGPRNYITHHSHFPEEGDMFIFPAGLKHWVFPFKSDCTRVSVSGNVSNSIKFKNLQQRKAKDDK